jgi:hypothetical protein
MFSILKILVGFVIFLPAYELLLNYLKERVADTVPSDCLEV